MSSCRRQRPDPQRWKKTIKARQIIKTANTFSGKAWRFYTNAMLFINLNSSASDLGFHWFSLYLIGQWWSQRRVVGGRGGCISLGPVCRYYFNRTRLHLFSTQFCRCFLSVRSQKILANFNIKKTRWEPASGEHRNTLEHRQANIYVYWTQLDLELSAGLQ